MSINCETHTFTTPCRAVLSAADIEKWEKSEAYQDILGFLTSMNNAVKGKALSCSCNETDAVKSVVDVLSALSQWVDEIPPTDQPHRYGNKAFRDFYSKLKENCANLLQEKLPITYHPAIPEISIYLIESFGNATRIDYGTGHEFAFAMFLTCLFKIGLLVQDDSVAAVVKIFHSYIKLARKLQVVYKMEPAGSQGVWSLDDYQFIPFIWGSSQLMMHPKISPEMFVNESIVEDYAHDYLFLGCIKFILSVKTGPFAEHSNQLWNISGVTSWSKVNQGLIKMYKAEVLNKFPVIQHVLFGSLLSITPAQQIFHHAPVATGICGRRPPGTSAMRGTSMPGPIPGVMSGLANPMMGIMPRPADPTMGVMPRPADPTMGVMPRPADPTMGVMPRPADPTMGVMPRPVDPTMGVMPKLSTTNNSELKVTTADNATIKKVEDMPEIESKCNS